MWTASAKPPHRERLTDPVHVRMALALLVEREALGTVEGHREPSLGARSIDSGGQTAWAVLRPLDPQRGTLVVAGYNSRYHLPLADAWLERGQLKLPQPDAIDVVRARLLPRAIPPEGSLVQFVVAGRACAVERALLDLSPGGLCFAAAPTDEFLEVGTAIPQLLLCLPGREPIALRAELTHRRNGAGGRALGLGCRISPQGPDHARRLLHAWEALSFPNTRRGAADVWPVYRSSGYFELSAPLRGDFEHLQPIHAHAAGLLAAAPQLGCQSNWPARGPALATAQNIRLTSSSWFSYHLAIKPDGALAARSAQALREVYRHYLEHALLNPGARWQMAYVQDHARWSRQVHIEIPKHYAAAGHGLLYPFRALELGTACATPASGDWEVSPASKPELSHVMRRLQARRPAAYCEALDYDPERFALEGLRAQWGRAGLQRERALWVARKAGLPWAAAVFECAQEGLHLFGLLDSARLYALCDGGEQAFGALIDAACDWFRQRGRKSLCYLQEEGALTPGPGVQDLGSAWLTLLSLHRVPDMLERLYRETAAP